MSLAARTVRGAAVSVAAGLTSRLIGLVATLLLTHFLAPAEYGEVAIATIVVMTVFQFSSLAVGVYLTSHPKAGPDVVFHATVIHVTLATVALVLSLIVSQAGAFFQVPQLGRFAPLLALAFYVDRLAAMPERMLLRKLAFPRVSMTRALGEVTYAATAIVFAVSGAGGMAVVFGNLARSFLRSGILLRSVRLAEWASPVKLDRGLLATLARHGFWVSLGALTDFAARKWDNVIVGKMFGPSVAGTYNLAYNLAELPALQVGEPINDVLQVTYAHAPEGERENALRRSMAILALVMGPLAFGLAAVAQTVTLVVFPAKWSGLGPMMTVLAILSFLRPVEGAVASYLYARAVPRIVGTVESVGLVLVLGLLWTVGRTSPLAATLAVLGAVVLRGLLYGIAVRIVEKMRVLALFFAVLPPLFASIAMAAVVGPIPHWVTWGPKVTLAVQVLVGAVAYPVFALLLARTASRDFLKLVRESLLRRRR